MVNRSRPVCNTSKMKTIFSILIFCLISCCIPINGSNILYLSLAPSPSHHIWDKTLALGLKARGHHITFVTHSPEKSAENFTTIIFEDVHKKVKKGTNNNNFDDLENNSYLQGIMDAYEWMLNIEENDLKTNGFQQLMNLVNEKPKFDLIIMDTTCCQYIYPIFEKLGNPPIIGTSPFGVQPYHIYHTGYELHPAYIPLNTLPFSNKMSFLQRAQNYFYTSLYFLYRQYIYMPKVWEKTVKYFGENIKPYQEVEKQFSLLLANNDPILDYPESLPPGVILVGGLHTVRNPTMPEDVQNILDNATTHGVILFSLGTNFLSKYLKPDQKQALIDGLGKLNQTILWKYEEDITGLPKNIITRTWFPQNSILAHPNVKAFITHGGALSTQEAMLHGVPVISMPFFADQHVNTYKMVSRKLGKSLSYGELTADIVYETVNDVLLSDEYTKNIKLISKRFRDQKEDPLTRAIWWVEYTIRQGGTEYLAVDSRDMPSYKLYMLDVWAVIFITILLITQVTKIIICKIFRKSKPRQQILKSQEKKIKVKKH